MKNESFRMYSRKIWELYVLIFLVLSSICMYHIKFNVNWYMYIVSQFPAKKNMTQNRVEEHNNLSKNLATIHAKNLKCFSCQAGNVLFFWFFLSFISFFVLFLFISLTFQSPLPVFQIRSLLSSFVHTSINTCIFVIAFIDDIAQSYTLLFTSWCDDLQKKLSKG